MVWGILKFMVVLFFVITVYVAGATHDIESFFVAGIMLILFAFEKELS